MLLSYNILFCRPDVEVTKGSIIIIYLIKRVKGFEEKKKKKVKRWNFWSIYTLLAWITEQKILLLAMSAIKQKDKTQYDMLGSSFCTLFPLPSLFCVKRYFIHNSNFMFFTLIYYLLLFDNKIWAMLLDPVVRCYAFNRINKARTCQQHGIWGAG